MAGDPGRVVHILRPHHRFHAIGGDEGRAPQALAALIDDGDAGVVLLHPLDAGAGLEVHPAGGHRTLEQGGVHIDAMDDRVRVAKALPEGLVGEDAADLRAVDRVVHDHEIGEHRAAAGELAHAQRIQRMEGIGAELHAGADLADLGRLLEDAHAVAAPHEGERRGQSADAATGHQHGLLGVAHGSACFGLGRQPVSRPALAASMHGRQ